MARTITEIFNDMVARKDAEASLSGLTSASQSAIWRLLFWVQAQSINLFEQLMDALKVEIQTMLSRPEIDIIYDFEEFCEAMTDYDLLSNIEGF